MKIAVTGGTGFIGTYVVQHLLKDGHQVIVTGVDVSKSVHQSWFDKVELIELNFQETQPEALLRKIASADKLIHLAWGGLPNYKALFHFEENLMPQYFFLKKMVALGLKDITVSGTCFEYGMREGCLSPEMLTDPQNPYAIAKDTLRKFLQQLQNIDPFTLKWIRLFYIFGKGQSEKSILSQLNAALENGDTVFNMSGGEQLRDYLPVEEVALKIVALCKSDTLSGIYNCSSGKPISIRNLVENHMRTVGKTIDLNLGFYPYPDYEPMAFWGTKD